MKTYLAKTPIFVDPISSGNQRLLPADATMMMQFISVPVQRGVESRARRKSAVPRRLTFPGTTCYRYLSVTFTPGRRSCHLDPGARSHVVWPVSHDLLLSHHVVVTSGKRNIDLYIPSLRLRRDQWCQGLTQLTPELSLPILLYTFTPTTCCKLRRSIP